MKRFVVYMAGLTIAAAGFAGMTFEDIDFWVGQGTQRAALVIDWNDGPNELVKVWGFRWDGTATGADLVLAVCAADADFYAMGGSGPYGFAIGGLGYDKNGNGFFDISRTASASNFDSSGYMAVAGYAFDGWSAAESGDVWCGGWETDGFWGYFYNEAGVWISSMIGASSRVLADGDWDGWSWGAAQNGWYGGAPSASVAVPEPTAAVLLAIGLLFVSNRK
ncbi:MAG TPA: PEP-CTERM sorting domain-containing protein [Anaerohalosphaeraceae bacterium]|nr:PEP-CTERM sorting domain-containing protein [Anaerohalosphaeraceae bacterium]